MLTLDVFMLCVTVRQALGSGPEAFSDPFRIHVKWTHKKQDLPPEILRRSEGLVDEYRDEWDGVLGWYEWLDSKAVNKLKFLDVVPLNAWKHSEINNSSSFVFSSFYITRNPDSSWRVYEQTGEKTAQLIYTRTQVGFDRDHDRLSDWDFKKKPNGHIEKDLFSIKLRVLQITATPNSVAEIQKITPAPTEGRPGILRHPLQFKENYFSETSSPRVAGPTGKRKCAEPTLSPLDCLAGFENGGGKKFHVEKHPSHLHKEQTPSPRKPKSRFKRFSQWCQKTVGTVWHGIRWVLPWC